MSIGSEPPTSPTRSSRNTEATRLMVEPYAQSDADVFDDEPTKTVDEKINDIFKQIGGFGRYQWFATVSFICGLNATSWILYQLSYLEKFPKMNCTFADGQVKLDCTTDDFCPVEGVK